MRQDRIQPLPESQVLEMPPFFAPGPASDQHYVNLRDGHAPIVAEARAFVEELWAAYAQYLDPDVAERARGAYLSSFWELYLVHVLHSRGIALFPRLRRTPARQGPDLLAEHPRIWIEAVAPGPGEGPDAVPPLSPGVAFRVPDEQMKLRLRSAIEEKRGRINAYRERGWVPETEPVVVAINGSRITFAQLELTIPRVIRCVLPFGYEQFAIDRSSLEVVERSYTYQRETIKRSGEGVPTDVFLDPGYSMISALLYSSADEVNRPPSPGAEIVLVRNPLAAAPLPDAWLPVGWEYWVEGNALHRRQYE